MTNLYHRDLLTDTKAADISDIIDRAIEWLDSAPSIQEVCRIALRTRLDFRKALLSAVNSEEGHGNASRPESWAACIQLMPAVRRTNVLSGPVESAFSSKIQRRLASSVPPRPVVNISFDDADAFFVRTCVNAQEAFGVLRWSGASHIMVRCYVHLKELKTDRRWTELRMVFSGAFTAATGLCSLSSPVPDPS